MLRPGYADAMARPATLDAPTSQALEVALRRHGLRLTRHRSAVLAVLSRSSRPLTADEVGRAAGVPTSTAYRNLAELVAAGVVVRVGGVPGGDRHELAEGVTERHHHHLVCTSCGDVTDFDPSRRLEQLIAEELRGLVTSRGFAAAEHVFDVRGQCRDCAATT